MILIDNVLCASFFMLVNYSEMRFSKLNKIICFAAVFLHFNAISFAIRCSFCASTADNCKNTGATCEGQYCITSRPGITINYYDGLNQNNQVSKHCSSEAFFQNHTADGCFELSFALFPGFRYMKGYEPLNVTICQCSGKDFCNDKDDIYDLAGKLKVLIVL